MTGMIVLLKSLKKRRAYKYNFDKLIDASPPFTNRFAAGDVFRLNSAPPITLDTGEINLSFDIVFFLLFNQNLKILVR